MTLRTEVEKLWRDGYIRVSGKSHVEAALIAAEQRGETRGEQRGARRALRAAVDIVEAFRDAPAAPALGAITLALRARADALTTEGTTPEEENTEGSQR